MSEQESLFGADELPETEHEKHWKEMPEYNHKDMQPAYQILVSFESVEDLMAFGKLLDQRLTRKTQSVWYPEVTIDKVIGKKRFAPEEATLQGNIVKPPQDTELTMDPEELEKIEWDHSDEKLDEQMIDLHLNQADGIPEMPPVEQLNIEPTREEMANAAGAAAGEVGNKHFEKTVSDQLFPDDPEKSEQMQEALAGSRDELREKQNAVETFHSSPGKFLTTCTECDGEGYPKSGDAVFCLSCNGMGKVEQK